MYDTQQLRTAGHLQYNAGLYPANRKLLGRIKTVRGKTSTFQGCILLTRSCWALESMRGNFSTIQGGIVLDGRC
jgi:hypothetical protein